MSNIDWSFTPDNKIVVHNDTFDLYRFFDATPQVEYLYGRVLEAVRVDFKEELEFVEVYDRAFSAIRQVIDMPDRRASLLAKLCLQNGGRLSNKKRAQFSEVRDEEIRQIEDALAAILRSASEVMHD
jgi:hypothetical protein